MIEILVSIVMITIGLLGAALTQAYGLKLGKSAGTRTQAVVLATEIGERMETNLTQAVTTTAYEINTKTSTAPITVPAPNCESSSCTPAQMSSWDIYDWQTKVAARLPGASWRIRLQRADSGPSACDNTPGAGAVITPRSYQICVWWTDRRDNTNYGTTGGTEEFSFASTKSVFE